MGAYQRCIGSSRIGSTLSNNLNHAPNIVFGESVFIATLTLQPDRIRLN